MNACEGNANGEGAVPSVFQPSDAVAPQQGTGFTRLKDPSQMRMVLIVEAVACSGWEATFGVAQSESAGEGSDLDPTRSGRARSRLIRREASENPPGERTEAVSAWEAGPFSVKVKGSNHNLYTRSRKRGFRPEAAKQILGEGVRRSLRLPELVDHICGETGRTALRIGALEALWVQNERGGCRFLLAVHAVVGRPGGCSPDYPSLYRTLRWRDKFSELADTLTRILETHGGCPAGSVVFPSADAEHPSGVFPIFTITWVPWAETAGWIVDSDVESEDDAVLPAAAPTVPAAASELLGDPAGAAVALGFPADGPAGVAGQGGRDARVGRSESAGQRVGDGDDAHDVRYGRDASAGQLVSGGDGAHDVRGGSNAGDAEASFLEALEELQHGLCVPVAEEVLGEIRQEAQEEGASRGGASVSRGATSASRGMPAGVSGTASGRTLPGGKAQRGAIHEDGAPSDASLGRAAVAASGWKWGYLPSPEGFELGEEIWDEAKRALHRLSRSWAVSVYRHGAAYLQRREDDFSLYALQRICTRHVDVYLLTLFNRIRVRTFSEKLAALAAELEETTNGLFADGGNAAEGSAYRVASVGVAPGSGGEKPGNSAETEEALERLIAEALALDSDAVAFLAAEWWTNVDVGYGTQTDKVLEWAQKAGRLDSAVDRVVEQSRMLRDSVQTLLDRQERQIEKQNQEIEREQQRSARVMEWAVGCLAFIGIPMTAVLELWINWDLEKRVALRPFWPWWAIFIAGMLGSIVFGLLAVRRLGRRSRHRVTPSAQP